MMTQWYLFLAYFVTAAFFSGLLVTALDKHEEQHRVLMKDGIPGFQKGDTRMAERPNDEASTLVTSEYDFLRKEIATSIEETRSLERAALVLTGAIWAWLLTHAPVPPGAWVIPPVLVALAAYRAHAINRSFKLIATYISAREKALLPELTDFGQGKVYGWETFRSKHNAGVKLSAIIFWLALLLGSIVGAIVTSQSVSLHKDSFPGAAKFECIQSIRESTSANPAAPADQKAPLFGR